jgi:hypothetical protein
LLQACSIGVKLGGRNSTSMLRWVNHSRNPVVRFPIR